MTGISIDLDTGVCGGIWQCHTHTPLFIRAEQKADIHMLPKNLFHVLPFSLLTSSLPFLFILLVSLSLFSLPTFCPQPILSKQALRRDMCQRLGSQEMLEPVCTSARYMCNKAKSMSPLCRQLHTSLRKNARHTHTQS